MLCQGRRLYARLVFLALLILLVPDARGLTNSPCPTIRIICLDGEQCSGVRSTLKAEVSGEGPGVTLTYKWCVSAGTIISGQDTDTIEIDASGISDEWITVVILINGLDRSCHNFNTYRIDVTKRRV